MADGMSTCDRSPARDADGAPVGRVGAREGVDDIDVLFLQVRDEPLAKAVEALLPDRLVDLAPGDSVLGGRLAHDEAVFRRAARVPARVDDERAALGEAGITASNGVRVEGRRGGVPEDATAGTESVRFEAGGLGDGHVGRIVCVFPLLTPSKP